MPENAKRQAEVLAEKIKKLLEGRVTTEEGFVKRTVSREATETIRQLEKEILNLGYSVEWSVTDFGVTVWLEPKNKMYSTDAPFTTPGDN